MKKILSVLMIIVLVVSLAAVMTGCKGKKTGESETTGAGTEAAAESSSGGVFSDLMGDMDEEMPEFSMVERTTDEHYAEAFEELTLPALVSADAATTKRASSAKADAATTQAVRRETTTQFQITSPTRRADTTKAGGKTAATTSASAKTNDKANDKANEAQTGVSETTLVADRISDSHAINASNLTATTKPSVTYLDKYVVHVLESGSYSLLSEITEEGHTIPVAVYSNSNNQDVRFNFSALMAEEAGVPDIFRKSGGVRWITKNKNSASPQEYFYLEAFDKYIDMKNDTSEDVQGFMGDFTKLEDSFQDAGIGDVLASMLLQIQESGEYCGIETRQGYIVESYKVPESNEVICFYFDGKGLAKVEVLDAATDSLIRTYKMNLTSGVTDSTAFSLPGKKTTWDELAKVFENFS